jgi:ornithine carbamoyltransferase
MQQPKLRHFLTGEEFSSSEIQALLNEADRMKKNRGKISSKPLAGQTIALIFEKPSLRTRVSFTVGVQELGGNVIELLGSQKKSEDPEDSIRVLQGMVHGVMLRTFEHSTLERMVSKATIPIINGLSDSHHPCQALADLLTMRQRLGRLRGTTLCYIGDGNNVLHSLLLLAPVAGVNVHYACPQGYQPDAAILARAQKRAKAEGATIASFDNPEDAAIGAHALYTDVWTSMGQEEENAARLKAFEGYQINRKLLDLAADDAIILHCLPMIKGQEITEEMVEHPRSALFQQAENRLHAQKALLKRLMNNVFAGTEVLMEVEVTHGENRS